MREGCGVGVETALLQRFGSAIAYRRDRDASYPVEGLFGESV
jgi:hypothetical protein